MSSLKVFISSPVYVTIYPANRVSFDLPRWVRKDRRDSASRVVTIDPGTPPLSLLRFVWLNFGLPFSGSCSQDFLVFSLSRPKEVFYASSRICSSVQNKEEPPAHYKKRFCLFLTLQKVTMVLKTF